jgi:Helix-turn-helix domain
MDDEITTEEAAVILKCTARTVRNMIIRKSLPAKIKRVDPTTKKGVYIVSKKFVVALSKQQYRPG